MIRPAHLVFCALFLSNAHAGTYRWVDEKGNVYYSDQAPGADAKEVSVVKGPRGTAPASRSAAPSKQKSYVEMEAEFKKRRVEATEADAKNQKELAEAAEMRKNCETAQGQLKLYERGGRIVQTGPDGEQHFLDENGIAQGLAGAKKNAAAWCKS